MKAIVIVLLSVSGLLLGQDSTVKRPKITGIDHVSFYTTAPDELTRLYTGVLGLPPGKTIEPGQIARYIVGRQWVGYSSAPDKAATDRLDHIAFTTDDITALHRYLLNRGVAANAIQNQSNGSRSFVMKDPEGHPIEFVERAKIEKKPNPAAEAVSRRLIHAGFIVQDRAAEDRFYREILGFRPYWHGGMQPGRTDWVALQVPDGTDWLEYTLNQPPHPDLQTTGVMNHISLGVNDMSQAEAKLVAHGWKPHGAEKSQMGLDGKRQLNVFDADWSRVELMEFRPVQKPCCSDFQGPHPSEER